MYITQTLKALRINPSNIAEETEYLRTRPVQWFTPRDRNDRLVKDDFVVYTETFAAIGGSEALHDWRPIAVYSNALFHKQFGRPRGYRGWYLIMTNHPK